MYNFKVKKYGDSIELVYYDIPIYTKEDLTLSKYQQWKKEKKQHEKSIISANEWMSTCQIVDNVLVKINESGQVKYYNYDLNPFTGLTVTEIVLSEDDKFKIQLELKDRKKHSTEVSFNRSKNKAYEKARCNTWEYFVTFTFAPDKIDRYNFEKCNEYLRFWLNNMRKRYAKDLKFLLIPERHKDGAIHFHGLFSDIGNMTLKVAINPKTGREVLHNGNTVYNLDQWKIGFSTLTRIRDSKKALSYITKYICKEMQSSIPEKHRYKASRNLNKPEVITSTAESMIDSIKQTQAMYPGFEIGFSKEFYNMYNDSNIEFIQFNERV